MDAFWSQIDCYIQNRLVGNPDKYRQFSAPLCKRLFYDKNSKATFLSTELGDIEEDPGDFSVNNEKRTERMAKFVKKQDGSIPEVVLLGLLSTGKFFISSYYIFQFMNYNLFRTKWNKSTNFK